MFTGGRQTTKGQGRTRTPGIAFCAYLRLKPGAADGADEEGADAAHGQRRKYRAGGHRRPLRDQGRAGLTGASSPGAD